MPLAHLHMHRLEFEPSAITRWLTTLASVPRDEQYFSGLAQVLMTLPGAHLAFITECVDHPVTEVEVVAIVPVAHLRPGDPPERYALAGTLCAAVMRGPADGHWQATNCAFLHEHDVEPYTDARAPLRYMGAMMRRSNGRPLGHVVIVAGPDADEETFAPLLRTAAAQAAGELERRQGERDQYKFLAGYFPLFDNSYLSMLLYEIGTLKIVESNKMACHMYGCTRDEILGMTIADICPGEDAPRMLAALRAGTGAVDPTSVWRHHHKDGSTIYVNIVGHLFSWRGKRHCLALISDITQKRQLETERAQAYQEMEARLKETIVIQERNRLARDLHDAVSQTLWSAKLIAERLPETQQRDSERGRLQFEQLRLLIDSALIEMRTLLLELRPAALEQITLAEALLHLAEVMRSRTGLTLTFEANFNERLPAEAQTALYRIAQEAINNGVRHANGNAISITLLRDDTHIAMRVRDDGSGFEQSAARSGHYGLSIMRERAEAIHAVFTVHSVPGQGTEVHVRYPFAATAGGSP